MPISLILLLATIFGMCILLLYMIFVMFKRMLTSIRPDPHHEFWVDMKRVEAEELLKSLSKFTGFR